MALKCGRVSLSLDEVNGIMELEVGGRVGVKFFWDAEIFSDKKIMGGDRYCLKRLFCVRYMQRIEDCIISQSTGSNKLEYLIGIQNFE